ncbi:MAG: asparagine synthase (glutamine-hydrolyzing) [bacterium]|nr:asparagine synthase (glutamine-hydrolyzing) [bacterium]
MCGIGGLLSPGGLGPHHHDILGSMTLSLAHRGPDGSGVWMDEGMGIGLCHTRLAVIDLSSRASQPMTSPDGRGVLSYNGEVYNYRELKSELGKTGWRFVSDSDTEVVLAACLTWGVPQALGRLVGMFAFALWHTRERTLYLARDRIGIKPLYYGRTGGGRAGEDLVFASELKALCEHPGFSRTVDPRSLEQYFMLQYVPAPGSIYRDAKKLPPGHYLRLAPEGERLTRYWKPDEMIDPAGGRPEDLDERLADMIDEAISARMVSDVPLGTFLSGGLDSCLVTAGMRRAVSGPLSSYTVSYREEEFDESPWAMQAARQLDVRHHLLEVDSRDLQAEMHHMPWIFDEPMSDPSALPLVLLSRFARKEVTVILSGDGADELFGGYDRYRFLERYWAGAGRLPAPFRRALSALLGSIPPGLPGTAYGRFFAAMGRPRPVENFPGKWEKLIRLLQQEGRAEEYQSSIGIFSAKETARLLGREGEVKLPGSFEELASGAPGDSGGIKAMMDLDLRTFLPEDVLAKVDRASMAAGLEVRVPLLDHRVVSLSRQYPVSGLFEGRRGKAPLRRLARQTPTSDLVDRPKMGFTLPLDRWFRKELRDTIQDRLLSPGSVLEGTVDPGIVRKLVQGHLSGRGNYHEKLYNLMILDGWMDRWTRAA